MLEAMGCVFLFAGAYGGDVPYSARRTLLQARRLATPSWERVSKSPDAVEVHPLNRIR